MQTWIDWARGPVFAFAFTLMVLGLLRRVGLTAWETARAMRRAGDKKFPYRQIFVATLKWLFPLEKLKSQLVFSLTSVFFHAAVLVVALFLGGHIALWARGLGISWPAIPNELADALTIVGLVTAAALVLERATARSARALSRFQDYAIPMVIAAPLASGFLAMHPALNPFSFEATLLVHILSGDLIFVLIPFTKLSHVVLLPGVQLVSEAAWHWPPDAGRKVGVTLGKEHEPI
jgi:nitrate reductase gamma subunit